ncbi:metallophosphoesterase family protein, partial [Arachidicoccus sp.]|uniref:metallophosphoesterase family protein n=1 Tax=Arachidicoccus sp. TaxID=1872624 RepID=UPI003D220934
MKRRELLQKMGILAAAPLLGNSVKAVNNGDGARERKAKPVLTIAHITDVHIREGDNAPDRFRKCLRMILEKHKPDFFLNGGDSIHDASYDNVIRGQVTALWQIWDECIKEIEGYEIYACIGNHDTWWKAPSQTDEMYGKPYVVKRLHIPDRYYSFNKRNWHFIVLDGNNKDISLDEDQFNWLKQDLMQLPPESHVLLMSHYPILGTTQVLVGGGHSDCKALKDLFYQHRDKVRICLSGH